MINSHKSRWCDVCKMRVMARGHEHGQTVGEHPVMLAKTNADFETVAAKARAAHQARNKAVRAEVDKEFWALLFSGVERLK